MFYLDLCVALLVNFIFWVFLQVSEGTSRNRFFTLRSQYAYKATKGSILLSNYFFSGEFMIEVWGNLIFKPMVNNNFIKLIRLIFK